MPMFNSPTGNPQVSVSKQHDQYMKHGLASKRTKIIASAAAVVIIALIALWPVIGPDYVFVDSDGFLSLPTEGWKISKYRGTEADVVIPSEHKGQPVTGINFGAFQENRHARTITVPDSVEYIEEYAFCDCPALYRVTLPEGLKEIDRGTFFRSYSLREVVIPDGVEVIGEYAFAGCTGLTSLVIPDSVEKIASNAFDGCVNLEITAPRSPGCYCTGWEQLTDQTAGWHLG